MLNFVMNFAWVNECFEKCVQSVFVDSGWHIIKKDFLWFFAGYKSGEAEFSSHKCFPVDLSNVKVCW